MSVNIPSLNSTVIADNYGANFAGDAVYDVRNADGYASGESRITERLVDLQNYWSELDNDVAKAMRGVAEGRMGAEIFQDRLLKQNLFGEAIGVVIMNTSRAVNRLEQTVS
ncbi:hypothetical protein [Dyella sp.]|uniref:hypothetical protein n=1 Tax=Dyella sp. TaxID=1869338 RepID=UPI002FD96C4B